MQRRWFTQRLALAGAAAVGAMGSAWAQSDADPGLREDVGRTSRLAKLVPAAQVEGEAARQYLQLTRNAAAQHALLPAEHPQVVRLRSIAGRIIPHAAAWNERAQHWRWDINLLLSPELNAFCMPGGKIAFYTGILKQLQLVDDEVAIVMGHEVAHALREHARERMGKGLATRGVFEIGAALFGLGQLGRSVAGLGEQFINLKFSRDDETEADIVGLDLAARAGYDPAAGLRVWQKMMAASKGAPPQWMSTHPAGASRIREMQARLPKVLPLYEKADRPPQRFEPMAA